MKKLKFMLLILISIFCLNSCLLTTAAAGTYLLGTIGTYYCAEYDCTPTSKLKEKDSDGVKIFVEKKPLEVKSYFESIKKSKLIKTEIGEKEKFYINLPQNFILKRFGKTNYYLYDKEKNIGFFEIEYSEVEKNFEGTYTFSGNKYKLVSVNNKIFEFNDGIRYILKLKKISENYYAIAEYNKDMPKEILDIYTYLIENL